MKYYATFGRIGTQGQTQVKVLAGGGMGKFAAFTIAQNEPVFLPLWLKYYSRFISPADLFVLDHDSTDESAVIALKKYRCNMVPVHRTESFNHQWLCDTVKAFQRFLLQSYETVLFAETDEFVAPDPQHYKGLDEYVQLMERKSVACYGHNVIQILGQEAELDFDKPLLLQRSRFVLSSIYSKTLLSRVPLNWTLGFHQTEHQEAAALDRNLYLFHLHRIDYNYCRKKHEEAASRKWSKKDVEAGLGGHNRVFQEEEFKKWYLTGVDRGDVVREMSDSLRTLF